METQNSTQNSVLPTVQQPSAGVAAAEPLDPRKQTVIDYYALQGLMTDEEGNLKRMPVTELARILGVDRGTIYDWRDTIPGFWDKVARSRQRLGGQTRVQKVWNGIYLQAAKGKAEQAKIFLTNFDPDFRMPNDKTDRNAAETLIDLMNAARALQQEQRRDEQPPQDRVQVQQPLTSAPMPVIEGEAR